MRVYIFRVAYSDSTIIHNHICVEKNFACFNSAYPDRWLLWSRRSRMDLRGLQAGCFAGAFTIGSLVGQMCKIDRSCYLTACTPIGGSYGADRNEWILAGLQTGRSSGAFTVDIYKRKKIPSRGSIGATCI